MFTHPAPQHLSISPPHFKFQEITLVQLALDLTDYTSEEKGFKLADPAPMHSIEDKRTIKLVFIYSPTIDSIIHSLIIYSFIHTLTIHSFSLLH